MSSIDEVASAVAARSDEARQLAAGIARTKEEHDKLTAAIAATNLEDKAEIAGGIGEDLEAATGRAGALADVLDQLRARVEALKGLLFGSTSGGVTASPQAREARRVQARPLEDFDPKRPHREAVKAIRDAGYPTNAEGRISARGILYDAEGRRRHTVVLKAFPPGEAPARPELKEPWASSEELTTTWHVEGDAAADIREGELDHAVLYLNVPPCGKRAPSSEFPDPKRCYENLRHIIPADRTVWVHVVPEHGSPSRIRFKGTGEGIK